MTELITPNDIAGVLQVPYREVVDRITKRADFPRPALVLGKKTKRWMKSDFEAWIAKNVAKNRR